MAHSPQSLALICCDGSGVKRMLTLARALSDREGMAVRFALHGGDTGMVRHAGFAGETFSTGEELAARVRAEAPELLILDRGTALSRNELERLRRHCLLTAVVEESSDLRLASDFAYYSPLPEAMALDWTGARSVARIGWDWTVLAVHPPVSPVRSFSSRPSLLVAMGENAGLVGRAAQALSSLDSSFRIRFAIDANLPNAAKLAASIVAISENYETVEGADDFTTEYARADLALCGFGERAYELAAFGVPAIWLSQGPDDVRGAHAFAQAGMGVSLGEAEYVGGAQILEAVKSLMTDAARRREMREKCLATIDGLGAARIAGDLAEALAQEKKPLRAAR